MHPNKAPWQLLLPFAALVVGCSDPATPPAGDAAADVPSTDAPALADASLDGPMTDAAVPADTTPAADRSASTDGASPALACARPIAAADVSHPTTVVGTGTAAVTAGGAITVNCGGPATVTLTAELALPTDRDVVIDGGGTVTLDGGGHTRILHYHSGDYRGRYGGPQHVVTVQRTTFAHGHATGTAIDVPAGAPAACSRGTGIDGGGGAILVESGVLHVVDCTFTDNQAAQVGPDVAGGAVYATGSTDLTVVGSTFTGNSAANGGAVAGLNSDVTLVDDVFRMNAATGSGANSIDTTMCPAAVHGGEIGNGGNGGAVCLDGGDDGTLTICGCTVAHNTSGALGGGLFRTPDGATRDVVIDLSTFDGNTAPNSGGGAMYIHNSTLRVTRSTYSGNSARSAGAIQADGTRFDFTNVTLTGNIATTGVGGAFAVFNYDASGRLPAGTLTNCTVVGNEAHGMNYAAFAAASFGSAFAFNNCVVANNSDDDRNADATCANSGTSSHSVQWPVSWPTSGMDPPCAPGITFADPAPGTLGDHGGPTLTVPMTAAESVLRVGTNCPATDQAGHPRSTPCTVGALERGY